MLAECPHFDIEEFAVSASHPSLVEPVPDELRANVERLVRDVLCPVRKQMDRAIVVLSGYRSEKLNLAVVGSPTSQHRCAEAADVTCNDPELLFREMMHLAGSGTIAPGQVIYYPSRGFVHTAIPGRVYPVASFHVHEPSRGYKYAPIANEQELDEILACLKR